MDTRLVKEAPATIAAAMQEQGTTFRAHFRNYAGVPRKTWTRIMLPASFDPQYAVWLPDGGAPQAMAKVREVGDDLLGSNVFIAFTDFPESSPHEISGTIGAVNAIPGLPSAPPVHPSFLDGPTGDMLVWPSFSSTQTKSLKLVRQSYAESVWLHEAKVAPGLWWKCWYTIRAFVPTIEFAWKLTWSDRDVPQVDHFISGSLQCGEPFVLHHTLLNGMQRSAQRSALSRGTYTSRVGTLGMVDGGSIYGWGTIIGEYDNPEQEEGDWMRQEREAVVLGQTYGAIEWPENEPWMAGYKPVYVPTGRDPDVLRYEQQLRDGVRLDYYAPRPIGLRPNAGSTGEQEAFGATKATALLHGDPGYVALLQYAFMDGVRGIDHRDANGDRITFETNPRAWTFSGRINGRWSGVDNLGKPLSSTYVWGAYSAARPAGGGEAWSGIDDQHRSNSVGVALLLATGCDLVEDILIDQIETDRRAVYPGRPGAPRAVGRLLDSWAELRTCMPAPYREKLDELARVRIENALAALDRHPGPVTCIETKVDQRMGIFAPDTGEVLPAISVWEHALIPLGAGQAMNVWMNSLDLEALVERVLHMVQNHGVLRDADGRIVTEFATRAYNGGEPLPSPPEAWQWTDARGPNAGVWKWVFAMLCVSAIEGSADAKEYVKRRGALDFARSDRNFAEWLSSYRASDVRRGLS